MLINSYYYAPHNHSLLNRHLDWDLEKMASLGTDIVSFCVQEKQIDNENGPKIQNVIDHIHRHGMQAHVVPNRWAGITAGWLDGYSLFSVHNPDTWVVSADGNPEPTFEILSCVNNPKVGDHVRTNLEALLDRFDFDGLIWDEPHSNPCHCSYCRQLCAGTPTAAWMHARTALFLDEMSALVKRVKRGAIVSLFVQPHCDALFQALLNTSHIDYLGSDGIPYSRSSRMATMKQSIFEAHAKFQPQLARSAKRSFYLIETQCHSDADLENYLTVVDDAFKLPIDHMMYYFAAHEMSPHNADVFLEATWRAVARLKTQRRGESCVIRVS